DPRNGSSSAPADTDPDGVIRRPRGGRPVEPPAMMAARETAVIAVPVLLAVGSFLAVQGPANVQLAVAMSSPMAASTLQLAIGATLFLALAIVVGTVGALAMVRDVTLWHLA